MNRKVLVLWFALFVCALCACSKNDVDEKWAKEEADLEVWIKENTNAKLDNYIYIEKFGPEYNENIKPDADNKDFLLVDFVCSFVYEYDGDVERVSYKDGKNGNKNYNPQQLSAYKEGGPELWSSDYWVNMGLGHLREKESVFVYIPSRILNLQDFKPRKFEMHLVQVIDVGLKTYQEKLMSNYMQKRFCNKFDTIPVKDNKGNDYYVMYYVEDEGTGSAVNVASVSTHYDEYYFLQDNEHKECVTDKAKTGWDRNIFSEIFKDKKGQPVKKGGKITVVMPYRIMYGEQSYMDSNKQQYIAPPGSVLRYDIRIDP